MGAAWVLNLDAELELAQRGAYAPRREVREHVARFAQLARALFEPGDIELDAEAPDGCARGRVGRAWCPTPLALARLRAAGAQPEAAPSTELLRSVLERGFASDLRAPDGGAYERSLDGLRARLDAAPRGSAWLLKRGLSLAGRGRRRVAAGERSQADESWITASLAQGGLQVEPWRELQAEFALHGWLDPQGRARRGRVCVQRCSSAGAWLATRPAREDELEPRERAALERAFERSAAALARAGYRGPFGLDAYRHAAGFQPLSELNARYSMGWAVGFGRVDSLSVHAVGA